MRERGDRVMVWVLFFVLVGGFVFMAMGGVWVFKKARADGAFDLPESRLEATFRERFAMLLREHLEGLGLDVEPLIRDTAGRIGVIKARGEGFTLVVRGHLAFACFAGFS